MDHFYIKEHVQSDSNRFSQLKDVNLDEEKETKREVNQDIRKALKKLREIEYLEFKTILTPEEQQKVANKRKWQNILRIPQEEIEEKELAIAQEKKDKEFDKARKVFEKELLILEQKEANKKSHGMYRRQQKKAIAQEKKDKEKRQRERKEREMLEKAKKYRQYKSRTVAELEKEWKFSLGHMYNNDVSKTFRSMYIKYHPDKCEHHDDQFQKHLELLRGLPIPTKSN
jgi:hypothetical protein